MSGSSSANGPIGRVGTFQLVHHLFSQSRGGVHGHAAWQIAAQVWVRRVLRGSLTGILRRDLAGPRLERLGAGGFSILRLRGFMRAALRGSLAIRLH